MSAHFHFATQAVAGLPLSSREERAERRARGCRPSTLLCRGWAPTKTARTKPIITVRTISLKTAPNAPALERRRCFVAARPLGIRRKCEALRAVELSVRGNEEVLDISFNALCSLCHRVAPTQRRGQAGKFLNSSSGAAHGDKTASCVRKGHKVIRFHFLLKDAREFRCRFERYSNK
jgi:hypothetical protein